MTAKLKERLETARKALASALAASSAGDKQLAKLERDRASVAAQLEKLEAATERDPEDDSAIARLATLREQRRLYDKRIAKLTADTFQDERPRIALAEAVRAAMSAAVEWGQPSVNSMASEAAEAFRPFYREQAQLELAAAHCAKVQSFKAWIANAGAGPVNEKPKRLLCLLDRILATGDCGWTWQELPARPTPAAKRVQSATA